MNEKILQKMQDEMEIRDLLARNVRAADRCDVEMLKSTYWPDGTYSHVFTQGNAHESADFIISMMRQRTASSTHNLGSSLMQIDGDVACCETYATNFIRINSPENQSISVILTARLLDRMERRNGEWRISERKVVPEWELNGAALAGEEAVKTFLSVDRRGPSDESYQLFSMKTLK